MIAQAQHIRSMNKLFSALCVHLGLVSCLGGASFVNPDLANVPALSLESIIDSLANDRSLEVKYTIESIPGPDFITYRVDGSIPLPKINSDQLLELNTFRASQEVVWGAKAFHLRSTEKNNGITIERQRLLSADGLQVDYYPERPSAYIRQPDYVPSQFSLVNLLGMLPSGLNSLRDPVRPGGWVSFSELAPFLIESGSLEKTTSGYTFSLFKKLEESSRGTGFSYQFSFNENGDESISLSSIDIAISDNSRTNKSSFRQVVWRTELLDFNADGFPSSTHTRIWRYRKDPETNEYRQYLVREIKCTIQSIGFADADYDFSLDFDVGTFVTDEMTGSQYRVGNPLNSLMEEVAK